MCTGDCSIKTCYGEAHSNLVLLIGISLIFSLVKRDKGTRVVLLYAFNEFELLIKK